MTALQEFFLFRGRLRRRTYWGRMLGLYAAALGAYAGLEWMAAAQPAAGLGGLLLLCLLVAMVVLVGAVQTVKRLHDTGLSGWWWWLLLLPWVGRAFGLGVPLVDGTSGPNRFGADPKGRPAPEPRLPVLASPPAPGVA